MNLYNDEYICSDCGEKMYLKEGAESCPFCNSQLYRTRSGFKRTARVCKAASAFLIATALPLLISALAADSGWACLAGSALFALGVAAQYNGRKEAAHGRKV